MSYPLKSKISRTQLKGLLAANPVFYALSADQKNYCIDKAVQKQCDFLNGLDKEDYKADSIANSVTLISVVTLYGTTADRVAYGASLGGSDISVSFFDTDLDRPYWWNGTEWV